MQLKIKQQGLNAKSHFLVVGEYMQSRTRTCAKENTCSQELEPVLKSKYSHIRRVPFRTESGIVPLSFNYLSLDYILLLEFCLDFND